MPSVEQSERIGGAAFLGVPALDCFVSFLDTYARIELLVGIHHYFPSWLTNPVTQFVCLILGLFLLYLSNNRQLQRVYQEAKGSRLFDGSGNEIARTEKLKWPLPVAVSFAIAFAVSLIAAVSYALAYEGPPIPSIKSPPVPLITYVRTGRPSYPRPPVTQECAPGASCATSSGQQGGITAGVVNIASADRHLSPEQKAAIVSAVQGKLCRITMAGALSNVGDAQNYALELLDAFRSGGCIVPDDVVPLISTREMWRGIKVVYHDAISHVQKGGRVYTASDTPPGVILNALDSAHLGPVVVGGDADTPKDMIQLAVGGRPN